MRLIADSQWYKQDLLVIVKVVSVKVAAFTIKCMCHLFCLYQMREDGTLDLALSSSLDKFCCMLFLNDMSSPCFVEDESLLRIKPIRSFKSL